jgi:hypothetical protein
MVLKARRRPYDRLDLEQRTENQTMSQGDGWSPDEPLGTEAFEQGDEALDDETRLDPEYVERVGADPSLEPGLQVDDRELDEAGAQFDDPEAFATLDGGIDDPDGVGETPSGALRRHTDEGGWDLDAPVAGDAGAEDDSDG